MEDNNLNVSLAERVADFDFNRVMMALCVIEKITTVSPKSSSILGLATAIIDELNEQAKEIIRLGAKQAKQIEALQAAAAAQQQREAAKDTDEDSTSKASTPTQVDRRRLP